MVPYFQACIYYNGVTLSFVHFLLLTEVNLITFVCLSLTFFLFVCLTVFILLELRNEPSDVYTLGKHSTTEPHTQATFNSSLILLFRLSHTIWQGMLL